MLQPELMLSPFREALEQKPHGAQLKKLRGALLKDSHQPPGLLPWHSPVQEIGRVQAAKNPDDKIAIQDARLIPESSHRQVVVHGHVSLQAFLHEVVTPLEHRPRPMVHLPTVPAAPCWGALGRFFGCTVP